MTKTAIIEYNEADEDLLQLFFLKISVKFKKSEQSVKAKKLSKKSEQLLREMGEAIEECNAVHQGEQQPTTTIEQLFEDLKEIANNETPTLQTV